MIETLEHYADLTREAMAEAIAGGEPADYLYDLVRDYAARKGKGLRPGLLLAAADACGAATRTALPAAAALELLHTAFLIHDDVEDRSRLRRGRPTLHELHGAALAINAGDALANLAIQPLTSSAFPRYRSREVLAELRMAIRQTTEGQALELGWRRHAVVDLTRWTTWSWSAGRPAGTRRWRRCGSAPSSGGGDRIRPRWIGSVSWPAAPSRSGTTCSTSRPGGQAGKAPRSDIVEGKRTLMLIHLLGVAGPADRAWVVDYLARAEDDRSPTDQERLLELMIEAGSLAYAERFAAVLAAAAQQSLETAFAAVPPSPALDLLRELIDYLVSRTD